MSTYYIIKLDVDANPYLNEAFAIFDDDVYEVEREARNRANGLMRPVGTAVVWSYYGPFELAATDRTIDSCNFGVV